MVRVRTRNGQKNRMASVWKKPVTKGRRTIKKLTYPLAFFFISALLTAVRAYDDPNKAYRIDSRCWQPYEADLHTLGLFHMGRGFGVVVSGSDPIVFGTVLACLCRNNITLQTGQWLQREGADFIEKPYPPTSSGRSGPSSGG